MSSTIRYRSRTVFRRDSLLEVFGSSRTITDPSLTFGNPRVCKFLIVPGFSGNDD